MRLLAIADARSIPLASYSVHCVVTSPPYWGLRDYGVPGQLGLEKTPDEYVAVMVAVFREVRRVLRDDGTCWLNLGDSYAGSWGAQGRSGQMADRSIISARQIEAHPKTTLTGSLTNISGLKPKDLVGIPWRVAFALQADGWYLRSDIIWSKPNPMPESVTDRPTKAHEYLFLLTKSARYYYDAEAIREADVGSDHPRNILHKPEPSGGVMSPHAGIRKPEGRNGSGRNRRTVWTVATQPYSGAHFATFPAKLIEPCIFAGTSERGCCPECGAPWERVVERTSTGKSYAVGKSDSKRGDGLATAFSGYDDGSSCPTFKTTGWRPTCDHEAEPVPCVVLDPFVGSGTTVAVAVQHNRRGIGLDLGYQELARKRTTQVQRSFA